MAVLPPSLPYQAVGSSFVVSRRIVVATTNETPIKLFTATTREVCWNVRNSFCWQDGHSVVLSAYADPVISDIGTVQMPINLRIGSANTATAIVSSDPTATNYGTYLASYRVSTDTGTSDLLILIDPGHSLLITATASTTTTDIGTGFSWYELDTTHIDD